ncbi:MAG: IS1380 family transposase [Thermoleophilia bacterium]
MAQGILPFRYEAEPTASGMTSLVGLPAYIEMATVCGLSDSIQRHVTVCAQHTQGWTDVQVVMSLVLLNLAGGDCVDDMRVLEGDEGFTRVLRRVELHNLPRRQRREQEWRWRKERKRAVPSPSAVFRYLSAFHDPAQEARRVAGRAFIPASNEHLRSLARVNQDLLRFAQLKAPQGEATLDQDATVAQTHKAEALYSYLGDKSFQPLTTRWWEQDMVAHSEFRDGNVPASFDNLRALEETLEVLPEGVEKVYYRGDTASYQQGLLRYCAEGKNERFGVIEFAIGVDVTPAFKRAVREVEENQWQPLVRVVDGRRMKTDQEWAEVCFVPNWVACQKDGPEYRFLAIREPLRQSQLPGLEPPSADQLPFPTLDMGQGSYKLFGVVTNRSLPGDELIHWYRGRCGKCEEAHAVMKNDLAGGHFPSAEFGANAAWWGITVLAYNLNSLMQRLVLPEGWAPKRMKAVRFGFINLAGRVVTHARQLIIRVGANQGAYGLLLEVRRRMRELWTEHTSYDTAQAPP